MTKKHFIALANALKAAKPVGAAPTFVESDCYRIRLETWTDLCKTVATVCGSVNPRFNRSTFLAACDVEGY